MLITKNINEETIILFKIKNIKISRQKFLLQIKKDFNVSIYEF